MISAPKPEYREFTAEIGQTSAEFDAVKDRLPRLFLLKNELIFHTRRTELRWIESVLADLHSGAMDWSRESPAELSLTLEKPDEHPDPEEHTS
ncbi:hypothetical protein IV500_13965 [Paeniglutamicibacter antarcticus]|uniref:Uncharacterized protein n=1 Tax=Arthrobacter terrae TaxID=2935737 RepID=A0A931GB87_9MICC|nr:hypothetical protein [Arthrobacter terrae]MBG0740487.1 hypothetical protein [Arthrobacter terrae]